MSAWLKLSAFILCMFFFGCSPTRHPVLLNGEQVGAAVESLIISVLQVKSKEILSYRGLVQARLGHDSGTQAFRYVMVFREPDDLRLEVLPTLGAFALQLMLVRNGTYVFLDTNEKQAWQGNDPAGALARLLRLRLTPSELMAYITGRVPAAILDGSHFSKVLQDDKEGTLTLVADHGVWVLDSKLLTLREAQLRDRLNSKLRLEISFADYNKVGDLDLPGQVAIKIVENDMLLELKPQVPTINQVISDKLFTTVIPESYEVHK